MPSRPPIRILACALVPGFLSCCAAPPDSGPDAPAATHATAPAREPRFAGRPTRAEAAEMFAKLGVQPGQPLPPLSLVDLDGRPADTAALQRGRPLVLVTCSLTCNIARRQQAAVNALRATWGDRVAVAMVYTIEAHPKGDASPYTGEEWVPPANEQDGVLVRQPATLAERIALAQRYAERWAGTTPVLVDTMDDATWRALGEAPHVGLCIGADGVVVARTGWFDPDAMQRAVATLLRTAPPAR